MGAKGIQKKPGAPENKRLITCALVAAFVGASASAAVIAISPTRFGGQTSSDLPLARSLEEKPLEPRSVWQLLALSDTELEKVDVVEMNLVVAREIPGLKSLDVAKYQKMVDQWAKQIAWTLEVNEFAFRKSPKEWKNDIRFFRLGQVAQFLDQQLGVQYVEEQKHAQLAGQRRFLYKNPGDLFLHGLFDTKQGTCGTMPLLHVAIGRRLGWPVSLASVGSHAMCRFDDGHVVYNIEATDTGRGGFAATTDEEYIKQQGVSQRAIHSGSDLHAFTAREMIGYFVALRGRHFADTDRMDLADRDYALARALLPNHRRTHTAAFEAAMLKGTKLFEPWEDGHPSFLARRLKAYFGDATVATPASSAINPLADIEQILQMNRMSAARQTMPPNPTNMLPNGIHNGYVAPPGLVAPIQNGYYPPTP